jgi:hypothetical protein
MTRIKTSELRLGDRVRFAAEAPFMDGVVVDIKDRSVSVARPCLVTDDFVSTAGLGYSTGVERFALYANDDAITLLERRDPEEHWRKVTAVKNHIAALLDEEMADAKARGDHYSRLVAARQELRKL